MIRFTRIAVLLFAVVGVSCGGDSGGGDGGTTPPDPHTNILAASITSGYASEVLIHFVDNNEVNVVVFGAGYVPVSGLNVVISNGAYKLVPCGVGWKRPCLHVHRNQLLL